MENTAIDEATSPATFDVLSFVEKTAYPTEFVTIFTDIVAARDLQEVHKHYSDPERAVHPDDQEIYESKVNALEEKLKSSSLTFKLRGFPPGIVTALIEQYATDENPSGADVHVMARAIVSVTDGQGQVDNRTWKPDDVEHLKAYLAEGQFLRLLQGTASVVFNAAVFDQVTDAGFLGGRADVAPEL